MRILAIRSRSIVTGVCLLAALSGCQSYEKSYSNITDYPLLTSGYSEAKGPGDLIKVEYKGDFLTMYRTELFALYRCVEIARREGKPYFALYRTLPDALEDRRSEKNVSSTVLGKPYSYAYIRLHDAPGPMLLSTDAEYARLVPLINGDAGK